MRAFRLCCTTLVLDDARYGNLPGVEYYEVEVAGQKLKFAQHDRAVLPALLEELVRPSVQPFPLDVLVMLEQGVQVCLQLHQALRVLLLFRVRHGRPPLLEVPGVPTHPLQDLARLVHSVVPPHHGLCRRLSTENKPRRGWPRPGARLSGRFTMLNSWHTK
ncbi:MAG: hypothetical protein EOO40_06600 [Deltaproteobacteria bacterium]|nr:MAG: hypothetical protein EOO40_06600 [Deltaproteobacteria bacterium]